MVNSAQSTNPTNQNFFFNAVRGFGQSFRFTNTANIDRNTPQTSLTRRTKSTQSSSQNDKEEINSKPWLYDSEGFSRAQTRHAIQASIRTLEAYNAKQLKSAERNQNALDPIIASPPRQDYPPSENSENDSPYNTDTDPIIDMVVIFRSDHRQFRASAENTK
jgi:hypothetical protein